MHCQLCTSWECSSFAPSADHDRAIILPSARAAATAVDHNRSNATWSDYKAATSAPPTPASIPTTGNAVIMAAPESPELVLSSELEAEAAPADEVLVDEEAESSLPELVDSLPDVVEAVEFAGKPVRVPLEVPLVEDAVSEELAFVKDMDVPALQVVGLSEPRRTLVLESPSQHVRSE